MLRYIYPPRPKQTIPPGALASYENKGYIAQRKFNGTRNLVYVPLSRECYLMGRHGESHKNYSLSSEQQISILELKLDPAKEYVFDSELMHHKTKNLKDVIVLYDLLWSGDYLFGVSQLDRLKELRDICGDPGCLEPQGRGLVVHKNLWLAETFTDEFEFRFYEAYDMDGIEGVILRKLNSKINNQGVTKYETNGLIRCRKPTKHSPF